MHQFLPSFRNLSCIFIFFFFSGGLVLNAQDYALEFDGANNYVQIDPFESLYDETDLAITVEAWIFPTDLSARHTVFSTRNGNAGNSWQLEVGAGASHSDVVAVAGVNSWVAETENQAIQINQWTHVAMVYQLDHSSGTSNTQIYVNGELAELQQETDYEFIYNGDPITIGVGTNGGSYFEGRIDEVRVWSEARAQEAIQETMMSGPTGDENTLEAYYKMDDGPGTTVSDNSLNSNTGHLKPESNEPAWVGDFNSTVNNHGLELDGTDDLINLGSPDNLDVSNTLTVEAWVYPTSLAERDVIYSTRSGGSTGCWQLEIGKGNNNTNVVAVTGPGTWVAVSEDNAVVPDQWNHVVFVRNGESDKGAFYVNGREVALQQQTDFSFIDNNDQKTIGNGFEGNIDEVRIWNIARSKEEIRQNMMHPLNGTEAGLVAYYRFGEGSGTTTWDISSNSNSGSLEGNPQWVNDVFPGEKGTEEDPISIASAFELYWLSVSPNEWDKVFQQTQNIDALMFSAWNTTDGFIPVGNNHATDPVAFSGSFNGQGYVINNLHINRAENAQNQGLFGYTNNAVIKNTNVINANINAFENTGGLIGTAVASTVSACSSSGSVSGNNQTGGLVGTTDQNTSINNSYSNALVTGEENTGGLIGKTTSSEISNSYSVGKVGGITSTGGLIGINDNSTISSSFWDQETSEQENSDGGTGKSTAEMTTQSNFVDAGWDFDGESSNGTENTWSIHGNINSGYPYLTGQSVPPEIKTGESDVSVSPATVSGDITSIGTSIISDHGICWNTNGSPTLEDNKTSEGETNTPGAFTSEIAGLSDLTTYYVRAYAINESGTTYGQEKELVVGTHFEGQGNEDNPFKIYTLNDLKTMGEHSYYLDKHFIQMNDINAYETRNWNGGEGWNSIPTFSGVYDGQDYHISNLYIDNYNGDGTGLFKNINGGKVANLGIVNAYISARGSSGALAGKAYSAEIINCFSSGTIRGKTRSPEGYPRSSSSLGGLIGWVGSGVFIYQCYSSASVATGTGSLDGGIWVGGLCGMLQNATMTDSYATGSARGDGYVGGLAGNTEGSTVTNSYSIAHPSGNDYIGGLVGYASAPFPENSFHDSNKTGDPHTLGASSTAEMTTRSFFTNAGWDFVEETTNGTEDIWNMDPGINNGYPFLTGQNYPHKLVTNDASDITATSATANGEITTLGSEAVQEHGFCWNSTGSPTLNDSKTTKGTASEAVTFTSDLTSLAPNTTYYVRAYLTDNKRTTYGVEKSFTTNLKELTIANLSADDKNYDGTTTASIEPGSVVLNGVIGDDDVSLTNINAEFAQVDPGTNIQVTIISAELSGEQASDYTLSLSGAPTTSANIFEVYQLTLIGSPTDGGSTSGEDSYSKGENADVSAIPATGYAFINWKDAAGNIVSTEAAFQYSMPAEDVTLTASFELIDYQLSITATPDSAGSTSQSKTMNLGDATTLEATPAEGFRFTGWTGDTEYLDDAGSPSAIVTMPARNVSLAAQFEPKSYTLSISDTPPEGGASTGGGTIVYGNEVSIEATPATGFEFINWSGNTGPIDDVNSSSATLRMPAKDVSLSANYAMVDYQLTINTNSTEGGTTTEGGSYNYGDKIAIEATPAEGYKFTGWTGATEHIDNPSSKSAMITMPDQEIHITAGFEPKEYSLALNDSPSDAGTSTGGGTITYGSEVTIEAIPETGYEFVNWTGDTDFIDDSNSSSATFTMPPRDISVTANYQLKEYQLAISTSSTEGGSVSNSGNYNYGDQATIEATPAQGYKFIGWTGDTEHVDDAGSALTTVIMPAQNVSLSARFEPKDFYLSLGIESIGTGTVRGGGTIIYDSEATIEASPADGYMFSEWTGDIEYLTDPTKATTTVTMPDADISVTAVFVTKKYEITIEVNPPEGGMISGEGYYTPSDSFSISATPASGYAFVNWELVMPDTTGVITEEATFEEEMPPFDLHFIANFEIITSVPEENDDETLIWPNPFDQFITLAGVENVKSITIMTQTGEVVYTSTTAISEIRTADWSKGVYILKIRDHEENVIIRKLIKQ